MRTNDYTTRVFPQVIFGLCLLLTTFFVGCDKDEDGATNGYFELADNVSQLEVSSQAATESYRFRASGKWKIESLHGEKWIKIAPQEGEGDSEFTLTVARNTTPEEREVVLTFMVDGQLQSNFFTIKQAAGAGGDAEQDSYMHIDELAQLDFAESEATETHTLRATGEWRIALSDETADWLTIEPMEGTGDTPISISVAKNAGDARTMDLLFYLDDELQTGVFPVNQEAAAAVLNEDFSWLAYGSAIFYTVDGETRFDDWAETRGWESTVNPIEKKTPLTYARQGFVKLGKTSYGGDLISPKLNGVQGTQDLIVSFKAVPYQTAAGTRDATNLKVNVIGPGEVSVSEFTIDNWPDYNADPNCIAIWQAPEATRSFVIKGATAETQIRFLGGDFDLRPNVVEINKNRIFLDDIVVKVQ